MLVGIQHRISKCLSSTDKWPWWKNEPNHNKATGEVDKWTGDWLWRTSGGISIILSDLCTCFLVVYPILPYVWKRSYFIYMPLASAIWGQPSDNTVQRKEDERPSEMLLTIGRTHTRHTSPLDTVWPCQIVEVVLHCHTQPECLMLQCSACQELYHEQCEVSWSLSVTTKQRHRNAEHAKTAKSNFTLHSCPVGFSLNSN